MKQTTTLFFLPLILGLGGAAYGVTSYNLQSVWASTHGVWWLSLMAAVLLVFAMVIATLFNFAVFAPI